MSSTWGECIKMSIFGGSHTEAIGVNLDGLPAGEAVDWDQVLVQMARRAPGQDPTATQRRESDEPRVLCGLLEGRTTGAPLCAIIENKNQRSKDYENLRVLPRPGHADYTAFVKYKNFHDVPGGRPFFRKADGAPGVRRGGGAAAFVLPGDPGGLPRGLHRGGGGRPLRPCFHPRGVIDIRIAQYFPVIDGAAQERMRQVVEAARLEGDSVGGTVECAVTGLPAGVGSPMFDGAENKIASLAFGIPALKGLEFGSGFAGSRLRGSQNNDPFYYDGEGQVRTRTNRAGGILGGITNGMPLVFRAAFKPTPSIGREQDTVDLRTGQNAKLAVTGRHDPCIVPRAAAALEAAACVAVLELLAESRML